MLCSIVNYTATVICREMRAKFGTNVMSSKKAFISYLQNKNNIYTMH